MNCQPINSEYILFNNIYLHCLILFIILFALFKLIIAPLTSDTINKEFINILNSIVNPETIQSIIKNKNDPMLLRYQLGELFNVNMNDPTQVLLLDRVTNYIINTPNSKIASFFQGLANNFAGYPDPLQDKTNNDLFSKIIIVIIILLLLAFVINIFPVIFGNKCTGIKKLGFELLGIFIGVGIIEYWFFTNIGQKYIPVLPSQMTDEFKKIMITLINKPLAPEYVPN